MFRAMISREVLLSNSELKYLTERLGATSRARANHFTFSRINCCQCTEDLGESPFCAHVRCGRIYCCLGGTFEPKVLYDHRMRFPFLPHLIIHSYNLAALPRGWPVGFEGLPATLSFAYRQPSFSVPLAVCPLLHSA